MEFIVDEVHLGKLTFVLSVLEKQGCRVFITAKDEDNRRIWKTPILDGNGDISTFPDVRAAIDETMKRLPSIKSTTSDQNV
jgi:hypothetical protein